MAPRIISKAQAVAQGLGWYFTGNPCGRGHIAERKVQTDDCRKCLKIRQTRWNAANRSKNNDRGAAWYAANKKKAKRTRADWREKNSERDRASIAAYQAAHREYLKLTNAAWAAANLDKCNAKGAKRRASQLMATPLWADLSAIAAIYREATLKTQETGIPHHVDHIVPLQSKWVCGLHCEANLQVMPGAENLSKSNRTWPGRYTHTE